jgi:hypothetical protein
MALSNNLEPEKGEVIVRCTGPHHSGSAKNNMQEWDGGEPPSTHATVSTGTGGANARTQFF